VDNLRKYLLHVRGTFDAQQGKQSGSKLADERCKGYCAQQQSSVIPVTNFVFNAAWQKPRLSDGTLGRHGRPDWSVIKSTGPKGLFEGWTDGRGRTK
jgi:hypothetical protein